MIKESFWKNMGINSLDYQKGISPNVRKETGVYYTGLDLAYSIIKDLFNYNEINDIWNLKFLEPCVGVGNFVISYLRYISENYVLNKNQLNTLINNIYVCDSDNVALEIYKTNIAKALEVYFDYTLPTNFNLNIGGSLVFEMTRDSVHYVPISKYFKINKFDIIVTNPPYKNMRAEAKFYCNNDDFERSKKNYAEIKEKSLNIFEYANNKQGANLYKYFVEEILTKYSKQNSLIGLLIPSSILNDKTAVKLREYIVEKNSLKNIGIISENNPYIDAKQSMAYLIIKKSGKSNNIQVTENLKNELILNVSDMVDKSHNYSLLILENKHQYTLLNKLKEYPKIREFPFIINMRGELDVTLNKEQIKTVNNNYTLLRGRHIDSYFLNLNNNYNEFVSDEFVRDSPKSKYIKNKRIACQQISNINKKKRLVFSPVPENYVLANSCNFISVEDNEYGIDLYYLLAILNSDILNWYFKVFSSNNHVNNYEIDELPVITNKKYIRRISRLTKKYINNKDKNTLDEINSLIYDAYINSNDENDGDEVTMLDSLNKHDEEISRLTEFKNNQVNNKYVMNNRNYSLSGLDKEIIEQVPPGGNWKNLSQETINKSKRLQGIQKSGGRTTLYGRLENNLPSYTITTYFNRPGNGANIHPELNRVLSTREGARLQGFHDDFYFVGNQREILTQIGNAVPPLIGYLIAKNIKEKTGLTKTVDLFTGAGGLLLGFEKADMNHILANELDGAACKTLKVNHPILHIVEGDITDTNIKNHIVEHSLNDGIEIICGGPPCQGFSLAGFRKQDDPRNQLIKHFIDVVEQTAPKIVVFENVVGLLSHNKGKTFEELKALFKNIGYNIHAKKVHFNNYGVPQRRTRVIILATSEKLTGIEPRDLFPEPTLLNIENQISVKEAINDLIDLANDESEEKINSDFSSCYTDLMRNRITYDEYLALIKRRVNRKPVADEQLRLF